MPEELIDDATGSPAEPPPAAPSAEDLQAQIAELREQVTESQRTAEFWADKAKANHGAPPAPAAGGDEEEEPDVLEAITTRGAKGFDALASKRGFIRRDEAVALMDAKAAAYSKEQALMDEYPDLRNRNSEFFKSTSMYYGDLTKNQGVPPQAAMEIAARQTELAFLRSGKTKPAPDAEKEARRLARIAAQSGGSPGGRRPAAPSDDEDSTELTAEQKHICDAMGVPYERYTTRAKAGVAMGGGRR